MRKFSLLALLATCALAACGGGGGGSFSSIPGAGSVGSSNQTQSENAIDVANALGTPVKTMNEFNDATGAATQSESTRSAQSYTLGSCDDGFEFYAPDKNGDANSSETEYFYDSGCTELARDIVRIYAISGSSETVNRTDKEYAINNDTPSAVRTTTVSVIDGTYGEYGYPIAADGFDRSAAAQLDLAGTKTLLDDNELVMQPASNGVNDFCADAAGYNATGIARLNETFGWQGGVASGTRTVNADGSVTWQATHDGSAYKGPIGSLSIDVGSANTACPIATPEYTLAGGTQGGSSSIPVTATFKMGWLIDLTVTDAVLASGNTLNVVTNTNLQPTNADFITGSISNGGTQIATFNVDTFGDGTLTITSSGVQYVIDDWHVVK
jgi:hypothetical protein